MRVESRKSTKRFADSSRREGRIPVSVELPLFVQRLHPAVGRKRRMENWPAAGSLVGGCVPRRLVGKFMRST